MLDDNNLRMKRVLLILLQTMALTQSSYADGHFITDAKYRSKVTSAFNDRLKLIGNKFFNFKNLRANEEEKEALTFLYAYMPVADVTDYPSTFYLDNVRESFKARRKMAWGKKIPELLFRHFVLPLRVNNEALDSSRIVFYEALKHRVAGKSMADAILEVNHWCHEKVTYQPSDARTSSPLATVMAATGRCGEQSTFTVAALRAIGIPARQVYTPRWAHTDDNHAWVEAWADGKWHFLGACEPEPVLDLGWFNAPASRAMLMHTRVFGDYEGPEEVMSRASNYTEINLTGNYADTSYVAITVKDRKGRPVKNARVEFKIYNYAEFYTAATKTTDHNGSTGLTAGCGDMLVWASHDGQFSYRKVSFGKDYNVVITLGDKPLPSSNNTMLEDSMDIVPPKENVRLPYVSHAMRAANQQRFEYEDSIRKAYESTFLTREQATKISPEGADFLVKSRGNHKTISAFIRHHKDNSKRVMALLATLTDKDLRDMPYDILEDSYTASSDQLSPRVENEMIILPFKHFFEKTFNDKAESFRTDPDLLASWIKKYIRINPDIKALQIAQTPVGVWKSKLTDLRSRDIFFVDVARSLGIVARKDEVTGKVQYRKEDKWVDVLFDEATKSVASPHGKFVMTYTPTKFVENPKYYTNFTISRIDNGTATLLNFEEGDNWTTWSNTFKEGYDLDEGIYMLTTGTRLANGNVLASSTMFKIEADETTVVPLKIRHNKDEVSVIGSFNSESTIRKDGQNVSLLSQTGRGYFILGVIGIGQEPTNHALHDIEKLKDTFDKWQRPLVLLFENENAAQKFDKEEFGKLPSTTLFAIDSDGSIRKQISSELKFGNNTQLPIFIIGDTFNRVVFVSQGYTIGLGDQLTNVIKKISSDK